MSNSKNPIFTMASESATTTTESYIITDRPGSGHIEGILTPLEPTFQSQRVNNDLNTLLAQTEPKAGDPAPDFNDDIFSNFRINDQELYGVSDQQNNNYFMGSAQSQYDSANIWGDSSSVDNSAGSTTGRTGEMLDTFDFLVKSLSSANNYVSMLTREQLSVLRSIRPGLLYDLLVEVAKVRNEKRMRRALPNECAFCKNNGENEECYSSHSLKDWRGRVLCPVLRAFRCPRCGATGDRAHTIKYCPENEEGLERSGNFGSRRRTTPAASLLLGNSMIPGTPGPVTSPAPSTGSMSQSSIWNTFGIN